MDAENSRRIRRIRMREVRDYAQTAAPVEETAEDTEG